MSGSALGNPGVEVILALEDWSRFVVGFFVWLQDFGAVFPAGLATGEYYVCFTLLDEAVSNSVRSWVCVSTLLGIRSENYGFEKS